MMKNNRILSLLCLGTALVANLVNAESRYAAGDKGEFGAGETWTFYVPGAVLSQAGDSYSARFTVFKDTIIDRAWQRLIGVPAETVLKVGIQQDDKNGSPDGKWLSSCSYKPPVKNSVKAITFDAVKMEAGKVYHLVIEAEQIKSGKVLIYASGTKNNIRPYDKAVDNKFNVLFRKNGQNWKAKKINPFLVFGNGDEIVGHIGQPYAYQVINNRIQGGRGTACGQRFIITDKEIPAGSTVEVDSISIAVMSKGEPTDPLIISLRSQDGKVLSSVGLQPDQADKKVKTLKFDKPVVLEQGQAYLLTTKFGGTGGTVKQFYFLPGSVCKVPGSSVAGWGGKTICFPVRSAANNDWSKFKPVTLSQDIRFTLHGKVAAKQ